MSFWSRSKNKKENTTPSTTPTPSEKSSQFSQPTSSPPSAIPVSSTPRTNGSSIPSPSTTGSSQSYSSARTNATTNGINSPPDSPSTINGITKSTPPGAPPLWSMRKFRNVCPFPRYGHAANVAAGKEGEIYVFGGLVKDKRKNDLFVIDSGSMTAYTITATGDSPSPRLGHACILVGNAFILFGGECATNDLAHDDSLYLLNTSTRQWTRAVTVGPRPAPRYGHTLNILGSRLLVFGGQVDGYYFNDLVTFDLNTLSSPKARWELVQAVTDPPSARTGHVCLSLGDKLVIFGGTDGVQWFNDTWFFDARSNSWIEVECTGHIPSPREGHAASLIGEIMYVFGGRGSDGKMLGDLYAFKMNSRKWFSFANMGIGPTTRCGHTMTTTRDKIIILGGESTSNVAGRDESTVAFVLDTSKIRIPQDGQPSRPNSSREQQRIRNLTSPPPQNYAPRPTSRGTGVSANDSPQIPTEDPRARQAPRIRSPSPVKGGSLPSRGSSENRGRSRSNSGSAIPQASSLRPRAMSPQQLGGMASAIEVTSSNLRQNPPTASVEPLNAAKQREMGHSREISENSGDKSQDDSNEREGHSPDEPKHSETHLDDVSNASPQASPLVNPDSAEELKRKLAWATTELALAQAKGYVSDTVEGDDISEIIAKNDIPLKDTRLLQALLSTRHQLARVKELVSDQTRQASERIAEAERQRDEALSEAAYSRARMAAARSGDPTDSLQNDRAAELSSKLAAAIATKNELTVRVEHLTSQLSMEQSARKLAEDTATSHLTKYTDLDKRRREVWGELDELRTKHVEVTRAANDARVKSIEHEAVANKLRIESDELKKQVAELIELSDTQAGAIKAIRASVTSATERAESAEKALNAERLQRTELERQIIQLKQDIGTVDSQRSKLADLESQLEKAREEADTARQAMLNGLGNLTTRTPQTSTIDFEGRVQLLQDQLDSTKLLHSETVESTEKANNDLAKANGRIAALELAHAESIKETNALQTRLSESLDQLHSIQEEHSKARTRLTEVQRDLDVSNVKHSAMKQLLTERPSSASALRSVTATPEFAPKIHDLERQLEESQKLREELEASQEQVMQNLSVASKRHKEATRRQREAEDRVKKLEEELERTSNMSMSGSSASDIAEANRRQAEAEKKLADSTVVFQDRLAQLEADYQSAVHYVKGTEKMIRRMKEELTKYKSQNAFLQTELHELKRQSLRLPEEDHQDWEAEKDRMVKEIESLQVAQKSEAESASEQIKTLQTKLDQHAEERDALKLQLADIQKEYQTAIQRSKEFETQLLQLKDNGQKSQQLETELEMAKAASKRLEQENLQLESRAMEAEEKVSLLLDQVENSVDTYRRSMVTKRTDGTSPPISPRSSSVGNRTSVALDSLAHELDQLRSHWESSTARYRLSTASSIGRESPTRATGLGLMRSFDLENPRGISSEPDRRVNGIHYDEGLSRWRDDDLPSSHIRQVTA